MKLVLHIGAGKTGSSSIQNMLRQNEDLLKRYGIKYLGMSFEQIEKKFGWQTPTGVADLLGLDEEKASSEVLDRLSFAVDKYENKGIHTLILSHEALFGRKLSFKRALSQWKQLGHELKFVVYVREYTDWVQSAYFQWGIKHKTYQGPLKSFAEWSKTRGFGFYHGVSLLKEDFPNDIILRNMSAVADVTDDFLKLLGIVNIDKIESPRKNTVPENELLFMRALFNSQFESEVKASRFDNVIGRKFPHGLSPEEYLQSLYPTVEDMKKIEDIVEEDREAINNILNSQGQNILKKKTNINLKEPKIDNDKLLLLISDILMKQAKKIDELEQIISKLNK